MICIRMCSIIHDQKVLRLICFVTNTQWFENQFRNDEEGKKNSINYYEEQKLIYR